MNSPNPLPPVTPLPSQFDSAVIRSLAYAGLGLVATILADIFGWTTSAFLEKGGRVIDAVLAFLVIAIPLYQAYRARKNLPNPPIAGTPAVEETIKREQRIEAAPTHAEKVEAMKCSPVAVILAALASLVVLASISACQTSPTQPFEVAETNAQKGYAAAGMYEIAQSRALDIMKMTETPDAVKTRIADADKAATPVLLKLTAALRLYETIAQIRAGPDGARLAEAGRRIKELSDEALPLIRALQDALGAAPRQPTAALEPIQRTPALAWSQA